MNPAEFFAAIPSNEVIELAPVTTLEGRRDVDNAGATEVMADVNNVVGVKEDPVEDLATAPSCASASAMLLPC